MQVVKLPFLALFTGSLCVCVHECGTHCLKTLEEAIEEKVPDDFAVLKGRNIPYEEIGKHCQRGWEQYPTGGHDRQGREGKGTRRDNNNNIRVKQ